MTKTVKPPTQGVGVEGFKADLYAADEKKIAWHVLVGLPKFQMFVVEQPTANYGDHTNIVDWINRYVTDRSGASSPQALLDEYAAWHGAKGYWAGEDIYGNLLEAN